MGAKFDEMWTSAPAVLGWAFFGPPDDRLGDLVQLRGAYQRVGLFGRESVVLMRSEKGTIWEEILSMTAAGLMVTSGLLRSDLEEIDSATSGSRVSVVLGEEQVLQWQTNQAHAGIILDRIAAGELDPHDDLLRAFRGTPSSEERLDLLDLDDARRRAGPGRVPTEEERVARLTSLRVREGIRQAMVEADERGDEARVMELADELIRVTEEAIKSRQEEFG